MTDAESTYPGRRESPSNWSPTTPARSWAELIETLQGGLAVLDEEWRLTFVSDRFLTVLGEPDDLVGQDLRHLLAALAADDPREFQAQFGHGSRIEFEQQFQTTDGERCWYRVTLVPSSGLGDGLVGVVFAKDITATSRTLSRLRDATVDLTEVESELHRRVCRGIHDGPIQLLAALVFQLGLSNSDEANELQRTVSDVASTLRLVIEEFSPELDRPMGELLEQWITPLLVASGSAVTVEDQRTTESGLAELKAAFVLICHVFRGATPNVRRTLDVTISDENGGERFVLTTLSTTGSPLIGRAAARFRAIEHHARSLGGTASTWLDDDDIRAFSIWIPKLTHPPVPPMSTVEQRRPTRRVGASNDVALLPQLNDSAWLQIAGEAPERLLEFDQRMRISFANAAHQGLIGVGPDELIGSSANEIYPSWSLTQRAHIFDQLSRGEFVRTDWQRENRLGDSRLIRLTISPRLDEAGKWQGLLAVNEDHTDDELLDNSYQTALADLTLARRLVVETSIRRLEEPLAKCEQLITIVERFDETGSQTSAIETIKHELIAALRKIKNSTSVLAAPPPSISDLDLALRGSLGTILEGRELVVSDNTDSPPSPEVTETVFRISREAVNNAVLHGEADRITITLSNTNGGTSCTIHDEGIGVAPDQLHYRPGHLGVRGMRERARERSGTCRIERHPLVGTLVSVWLPDRANGPSYRDNSSTTF